MLAEGNGPKPGAQSQMRPLAVMSRVIAAIFGGYAFSTISALFLSYVLPMQRADALLTGIMASFAIYTAAVIWVFAARTSIAAWLGLIVPSAAMAAVCYLLGMGTGA